MLFPRQIYLGLFTLFPESRQYISHLQFRMDYIVTKRFLCYVFRRNLCTFPHFFEMAKRNCSTHCKSCLSRHSNFDTLHFGKRGRFVHLHQSIYPPHPVICASLFFHYLREINIQANVDFQVRVQSTTWILTVVDLGGQRGSCPFHAVLQPYRLFLRLSSLSQIAFLKLLLNARSFYKQKFKYKKFLLSDTKTGTE